MKFTCTQKNISYNALVGDGNFKFVDGTLV